MGRRAISAVLLVFCVFFVSATIAQQCFSSLNFTSEQGKLFVNGVQFKLKGASWFGFETANNVVHGLWAQSYTKLLDFLANNGFNAIRVCLKRNQFSYLPTSLVKHC